MFSNILIAVALVATVNASREDVTQKEEIYDDDVGDKQMFDASEYMKPMTTLTTKAPRPEMSGPLYDFIVNICNVILEDFSDSRIPTYMSILRRNLKRMGTGFLMKRMIKKFTKMLSELSQYRGKLIKSRVKHFLKLIKTPLPKRKELFKTLNNIYTNAQDIKMDVYVYRLKRYGRKEKRRISQHTKDIFRKTVFDTIRMSRNDVIRDIKLKFALAVIEYYETSK